MRPFTSGAVYTALPGAAAFTTAMVADTLVPARAALILMVFPAVTDIFFAVPLILTAVPAIFHAISFVFPAVTHIFPAVLPVFLSVPDILPAVPALAGYTFHSAYALVDAPIANYVSIAQAIRTVP